MATTTQIIEACVERLKLKAPSIHAAFFPTADQSALLNNPRAALFTWAGRGFELPQSTDITSQRCIAKVHISLRLRGLNAADGACEALDTIRAALLGYCPPDCGKLWQSAEKYVGLEDSVWLYSLEFSARSLVLETPDPVDEPILTMVTYEEDNTA